MKRPVWNVLIDAASLVIFCFMISTGLLLKFVLPPGSGRSERLLTSPGRGYQSIDLYFGLSRHEWGEIHFFISLAFLILLVLHITLHWNWILAMIVGTKASPQPRKRKVITVAVLVIIAVSLLFPWLAGKTTVSRADYMSIRDISL